MARSTANQFDPDYAVPPGAILEEWIGECGMRQAELAQRMGRPLKTINEIVQGKAAVTFETALQLELVTGIAASFWTHAESQYRERLARIQAEARFAGQVDWVDRQPLAELRKRGVISRTQDKLQQLKELLRFYGVASPDEWRDLWCNPQVAYRVSLAHEPSLDACAAWLRLGELSAEKVETAPYDERQFRLALSGIRGFTREVPRIAIAKTVQLCAAAGVVLVGIPKIAGAPVYGVTRWLTPGRALIQLSLRGKWEDQFWFTLFHEAGHLLKHGKTESFLESAGDGRSPMKEAEADAFARDLLISPPDWRRLVGTTRRYSRDLIVDFARQQGICPAIVVGRLQHEKRIPPTHHNALRRRLKMDDWQSAVPSGELVCRARE